MSKPIISGANPFIHINKTPLNVTTNYNDPQYDDSIPPLYQAFLSDQNLKISFLVLWNNNFDIEVQTTVPTFKSYREFQIVKFDSLYLHGLDTGKTPDINEKSGTISTNPEIVQALFQDILSPYGIVLNEATIHDYKDFESINYSFSNEVLKEKLYDLVDYTFRKNLT